MKLRDILEQIDPIGDIVIWTEDEKEDDDPAYRGSILNVSWTLADCRLVTREENDGEPPIFISQYENKYGNKLPCIVANVRWS